jgi:hypothetical protein
MLLLQYYPYDHEKLTRSHGTIYKHIIVHKFMNFRIMDTTRWQEGEHDTEERKFCPAKILGFVKHKVDAR